MRSGSSRAADRAVRDAAERDRVLAELDTLATLLDSRWRIPFTRIRFGIDAILGLIPGAGDAAAAAPALYLVWRARRLGVPLSLQARMLGNVGIDFLAGSVPILGSVFDVFYKASRRNHALLREHVARW